MNLDNFRGESLSTHPIFFHLDLPLFKYKLEKKLVMISILHFKNKYGIFVILHFGSNFEIFIILHFESIKSGIFLILQFGSIYQVRDSTFQTYI